MVFSSLVFLFLFLPIALGGYFLMPKRARNSWLLGASLLFYAWGEGWYVLVMGWTIVFNWGMGLMLARGSLAGRRASLALAVAANLLLLIVFKYANFICAQLDHALAVLALPTIGLPPIHLPIGISFFTFQAISYVVDVYRGQVAAQRSLLTYGMYKAFWPQLIAGPIVRYRDIASEVDERRVGSADFAAGAQRFIIGLAKKALIANTVAMPADRVFALPAGELTSYLAWFGVLCYALQIYFDFSGYSDMAIGMARMCGFHFRENFLHPYAAHSVREFWRRWHISLSSWFRDYLYIPLGGNRRGPWRARANLFAVFLLCGLWHGASWTFVVWGLFHGVFLAIEHGRFGIWLDRAPRGLGHCYTLVVVLVGWVFFRAEDLPQALAYFSAMVGQGSASPQPMPVDIVTGEILLAVGAGIAASVPLRDALAHRLAGGGERALLVVAYEGARLAALAALFVLSCMWLTAGSYNPFIYFRF